MPGHHPGEPRHAEAALVEADQTAAVHRAQFGIHEDGEREGGALPGRQLFLGQLTPALWVVGQDRHLKWLAHLGGGHPPPPGGPHRPPPIVTRLLAINSARSPRRRLAGSTGPAARRSTGSPHNTMGRVSVGSGSGFSMGALFAMGTFCPTSPRS